MRSLALAALLALSLVAVDARADAAAKKYQVTGIVTEMNAKMIVVTKENGEKWELNRDAAAATDGTLKVGEKVTIQYVMVVASVEVKPKS